MKKTVSGIISAVLAVSALSAGVTASADEKETPSGIKYSNIGSEIDGFVKKYEAGLASCEVSVFDRDETIFNGYYGHADIENGIKADETTVYEWASASKLLVWTSAMQLWEQGKLDLDADIRTYLPDGFLTKLQYEDEKITMINLMDHNAGFQESWYENDMCGEDDLFGSLEEAVKTGECYQAYHVGEHTAYSNWGTALAGYIVERVSGIDYMDYVRENIFKPLGMEHTSIDPRMNDNEYVKNKRSELKCYAIYEDSNYNEYPGTAIGWVQFFPAGSVKSTLEDFAKFGKALVSENNPLFKDEKTRELMFSPTSCYGDSDIAKNCHGFWTNEHKIQTIGHAGNSNCSSMLQIDPVSGLGVVIMTNEMNETMFNYGIPELLYGKITERPEFQSAVITGKKNISGLYQQARTIAEGPGIKLGGMPWSLNADGTYSGNLFGIFKNDDVKLTQLADRMYLMENNGMNTFMYQSEDHDGSLMLEMMSADQVYVKDGWTGTYFAIALLLISIGCAAALIVKFIIFIVRKARRSEKKFNMQIITAQLIFVLIGIISAKDLGIIMMTHTNTHIETIIICLLVMTAGIFSLVNGVYLCYNTIRNKVNGKCAAALRYTWSVLGAVILPALIVYFEMFKFWTL